MGKVMGGNWEQIWVGYDGFSENRRVLWRFRLGFVLLCRIVVSGLPS